MCLSEDGGIIRWELFENPEIRGIWEREQGEFMERASVQLSQSERNQQRGKWCRGICLTIGQRRPYNGYLWFGPLDRLKLNFKLTFTLILGE